MAEVYADNVVIMSEDEFKKKVKVTDKIKISVGR